MFGLSTSKSLGRFARFGLLGVVVLMAVALVATVWTSNRAVSDASETVIRGQSIVFYGALRSRTRGQPITTEQLEELYQEHATDGMRYAAVFEPDGTLVAEVGQAAAPIDLDELEPGKLLRVDGRIRIGSAPKEISRRRGRARNGFVIEFEPTVASTLRDNARRSLTIGAVASGALLIIGIVLIRWYQRREALERQLVHERRLASLGEISAVLAHEIRNPVASLKGNAQLLVKMLPDEGKPRGKAERLVEESVRLEHLTTDLLEFARAGEIEREPLDPVALVREAADEARITELDIDGSAAPESWSLDGPRIRQVLTNLFENARQAGEGPIETSVSRDGRSLVYTIRDRGPGIEADDLEQIFEPFYTRKTRGTGLGLAVARRLIDLHRGTISASNHPEGGAVFRITIPEA